ncbi:hypothetical protein [Lacihabitans soyangensis]|nr:hypothetical protein [Lacihabitans soyangensis]
MELFFNAKDRFKKDKLVTSLNGFSVVALRSFLENISEPALFWLFGHYSAGIKTEWDMNFLVFEELHSKFGLSIIYFLLTMPSVLLVMMIHQI